MSFVIYGKSDCKFCDKAVVLLTANGYDITYIDVKEDKEALNKIKGMGCTTVPQIFHGGKHIGGFTDLQQHLGE